MKAIDLLDKLMELASLGVNLNEVTLEFEHTVDTKFDVYPVYDDVDSLYYDGDNDAIVLR